MRIISRTWKISVKIGLILFLWAIMLIGAVSIFSLLNKDTVYYGNRCNSSLNKEAINYLNQNEIIAYDYELKCNTLYLDLNVKDELTKEQIIAVIVRISEYYKNLKFSVNTQLTIKNASHLILASINNGVISLSASEL